MVFGLSGLRVGFCNVSVMVTTLPSPFVLVLVVVKTSGAVLIREPRLSVVVIKTRLDNVDLAWININ